MTGEIPIDIRKILFATDFSAHSSHAFPAALALAQHFGAQLCLFHAVHGTLEIEPARAQLEAFARERVTRVQVAVGVAAGTASSEIVKWAEQQKVDLIVMGTHGRTGLAHVLMGSVAESVMRHAHCQVLTIPRLAGVPIERPEPVPEAKRPEAPSVPPASSAHLRQAGPGGHCLVCAQPSEELVCEVCKARIRGEVLYRKMQDEKIGR